MAFNSLWALQAEASQELLGQLHRELAACFDAEPKAFLPAAVPAAPAPPYTVQNGVAVIRISGVIDRTARISFFTGQPYTEGQDRIRRAVEAALGDSTVRAILLSINSPGGTAAGTKELADFIAQSAKEKPIAAYADGLAASAAYWLAAATGRIFAPVTAQVGSIGVIAVLTDWTKAASRAGVVRTVLSSGQWKAAGSPDKALTEEERSMFQAQLEELHGIFKADVAAHMGITSAEADWAEGQTILGNRAQELGLVSQIVQDEALAQALLAASFKEEIMNLAELKARHPELVQELAAEIKGQWQEEKQKIAADAQAGAVALARVLGGDELAAKMETAIKAAISPEQIAALMPLLGNLTQQKSSEQEQREKMLDAMTQAMGGPLSVSGPPAGGSRLVADAMRRTGGK